MNRPQRRFTRRYSRSVRGYVQAADSGGLETACALGRTGRETGIPLAEIVELHGQVLREFERAGALDEGGAGRAALFLGEVLAPYAADVRGPREGGPDIDAPRRGPETGGGGSPASTEMLRQTIRERELAESELVRQMRESTALAEMGRIITSSLDLGEVYERFADAIRRLLTLDRLDIVTVDEEAGTFTDAYVSDRLMPGWKVGEVHRLEGSLLGGVVASRRGKVIAQAPENVQGSGFPSRFASAMMAPLIWREGVVGVLILRSAEVVVYAAHDLSILERIAVPAASAVANARLYEQALQLAAERERSAQLDTENRELARTLEDKDRFVSTVSHELKTPLASVVACVNLLTRAVSANDDPIRARAAEIMDRNCRQLNRLIGDLVNTSRLAEGNLALSRRDFDIHDLCADVLKDLSPILDTRRQAAELRPVDGDMVVSGDRDRIAQVVSNLVSNASKYSSHGSSVILTVRNSGDSVDVSVRDRGIGMSRRDQRQLFRPFFRGDSKSVRSNPGTGLGLHISRELVRAHGGDIQVESEEGVGTTITFSLPAANKPNTELELSGRPASKAVP